MDIREIDLRRARPDEYETLAAFAERLRSERDPDDPPIPIEERIRRWQTVPPYVVMRTWVIGHPERLEIIARADFSFRQVEHNRHVADFSVGVAPEFRRRGLGRQLLAPIIAAAQEEGRTLLISNTQSTVPAGDAFLRRIGAAMGLPVHGNQLDVAEVNRDLIREWQERASERASGFELMMWERGVPDDHLEAFARLQDAMNLAPRGELQVEDFHVTPERLRLYEQAEQARGDEHWRIVARERATGQLAGYTEVIWHPNRPQLLAQGDTVVVSAYQNRGLGRWLKAAMLEKVLGERPQVRRIRTGNAYVNEPMLKINRELGFRPYQSYYIWQVEVNKVLTYLDRADVPGKVI